MKKGSIVIDQSTTTSKVYLVDEFGLIADEESKEHHKYYPAVGWVEHDPEEIYQNILFCIKNLVKRNSDFFCEKLCLTNQRETIAAWDKKTHKPVYKAIVWQDGRTAEKCKKMIKEGLEPFVLEKTGLKIDPYFSATKMAWILKNTDSPVGTIQFGTIDSWLIYKLSDHTVHATDHTNASRTLLYNLKEGRWDKDLCDLFEVSMNMLPEIKCSDDVFARTNIDGLLDYSIPIQGVMGDSQAAFFAQQCTSEYDIKMTLGTGSSIMMNSSKLKQQNNGLVNVLGYHLLDSKAYGVEGIVNCNAESLNWARNDLELFDSYEELNEDFFAEETKALFVPALTGLSIPYWNTEAKGMFLGLDRSSSSKDLLKAVINGIINQLCDALSCFEASDKVIHVDGGLSKNPFIMQKLADLSNRTIEVSSHPDLSAMGAWCAGNIGKTFEKDVQLFYPNMEESERKRKLEEYHRAIDCVLMLANVRRENYKNEA